MKRSMINTLLGLILLVLGGAAAGADEVTLNSIISAHNSGAQASGIIAMINDPANSVAMTAADILTLRDSGVPESVITTVWNRIPAPEPTPAKLRPDDPRLVDFVRLINSGMSETIIAEQIRQSEHAYNLSVDDLLYLKHNGAQEKTIAALMATSTGAHTSPAQATIGASGSLTFDDLVLVKKGLFGFLSKDRPGELVMNGDTLSWNDRRGAEGSFGFEISGIEKVWFRCEAGTSENFCYQINFDIIKGDHYKFQDESRDSGSNGAVLAVMQALRTRHPTLSFGTSKVH